MITITPARYAKGKYVVRCPSDGSGFKTNAARIVERLGGRYVRRDEGYQMSLTRAEHLRRVLSRFGFEVTA